MKLIVALKKADILTEDLLVSATNSIEVYICNGVHFDLHHEYHIFI